MADFIDVNVKIGGKTQTIKMEKGVTFENKGGIYAIDDNGQLKKFDKINNVWTDASKIVMTNYQWKAFQNVANNDGSAKTYTKADIEKAQEMYRQTKFTADMSKDLPSGYKIESPKLNSKANYVQVDVTNGKASESATLKFQIQEISELKAASKAHQAQRTNQAKTSQKSGVTAVSLNDKGAKIENLSMYYDSYDKDVTYAYTATKGNKTSYYDENKKLVGTTEELSDGKTKYSDKNGKCLYYTKSKDISRNETHQYIYDSNSRLKFIVKYDYNNPRVASSSQGMKYEEYGKSGDIIRRGEANCFPAVANELDDFTPYETEYDYRYGMLYLMK